MNWLSSLFRKPPKRKLISVQDAARILNVTEFSCIHMTYLIWEVPLTEVHPQGIREIMLYEDEVLQLRDDPTNKFMQIVRRNQAEAKGDIHS